LQIGFGFGSMPLLLQRIVIVRLNGQDALFFFVFILSILLWHLRRFLLFRLFGDHHIGVPHLLLDIIGCQVPVKGEIPSNRLTDTESVQGAC